MSDSHEDTVEEFLAYIVKDPLSYQEFQYDKTEWDNIPTILPRFILFLSKHLEALTNKCQERFSQISTPDLQQQMTQKIETLEAKIKSMEDFSSNEREKLLQRIETLTQTVGKVETQVSTDKQQQEEECKVNMRDIIPVPTGEDFVKEFEKDERLAQEEDKAGRQASAAGSNRPVSEQEDEEPPNEFGIILKEKEWFRKTTDKYVTIKSFLQ